MYARTRRFLLISLLPTATRRIARRSFRAADWLARRLYSPDIRTNDYEELISPYDKRLRIQISTASYLEWSILMFGYYEAQNVRIVKRFVPRGGTSFDVGANVGCHTVLMADRAGSGGRVVAFEPHPEIANRLRGNIKLNWLTNVEVRQSALSSEKGSATLHSRPPGEPLQHISSLYAGHTGEGSRTFAIKLERMDDVAAELNLTRLDFIKIDTEGNEGRVLDGGSKTVEAFRPAILFEYDAPGWASAGYDLIFARDYFRRLSYRLYSVDNRRLTPVAGRLPEYANILAVPGRRP